MKSASTKPLAAALVTSRVTYIPQNYLAALKGALNGAREHVSGLILLDNLELSLIKSAAGLYALGCKRIASTLAKNVLSLSDDPRIALFESAGLPVLTAKNMNSDEVLKWVGDRGIDLLVNMRTRCIYKQAILEAPRLGCINIHHGLLPDYRGTMCDLYAISEGRPAGFSIHVMNKKIDAGKILRRKTVSEPTQSATDYAQYLGQCAEIEGQVLSELLHEIAVLGQLPEGMVNQTQNPSYTRNPNRKLIRQLQKHGLRL